MNINHRQSFGLRQYLAVRPLQRPNGVHAKKACRGLQLTRASYNKQGEESLRVDGTVTRLWKVFFKPGSGYTDRLGVAVPLGNTLDQVGLAKTARRICWEPGADTYIRLQARQL